MLRSGLGVRVIRSQAYSCGLGSIGVTVYGFGSMIVSYASISKQFALGFTGWAGMG